MATANVKIQAPGGVGKPKVSKSAGSVVPVIATATRTKKAGFRTIYIFYIGLAVMVVCIVIGIIAGTTGALTLRAGEDQANASFHTNALVDWAVIGGLAVLFPYGIVAYRQATMIDNIESRLPDFLRDVAEAGRFGMTLPEAIIVASKGRYGRLTEEIKRMASQLEWGVPVAHALTLFQERIDTPLTRRVVSIIIKANEAGGNVADVLTMVAHDTRETQLNEEQRKITMLTYLTVIYISFFVFLVTIIIMAVTFLPQMVTAGAGLQSSAASAAGNGGVGISIAFIPAVFLAFLAAVIVHAVGDGMMAGVIHSGRLSEGMLHGGVMLAVGWFIMRFIVPPVVLPGG
ncbi:MAG: type II secretion system F family protein [Euryarchaeota archaeon]|nr:type II secretion system F family protein [Euryarchaeota archaeon]MDE1836807.1 type II secretion system F family protein [Euryarchaeota archaeon]MDE1881123.1 type II secretion system F family protein [Euryarchaeota archaeon]MDE2044791.1 type II secretion system F family protein [Thermoplasmata archaeon]